MNPGEYDEYDEYRRMVTDNFRKWIQRHKNPAILPDQYVEKLFTVPNDVFSITPSTDDTPIYISCIDGWLLCVRVEGQATKTWRVR
jgi:hypothetical protein